jgi:hypothetical protein
MELEQKQMVETVENKNEIEINEDFSDNDTQTQQEEQKEQKEQSTEEIPKKQDKKTNAEYAQKRREQERLEQERKALERQAELRGIRKALKNTNPYTDEPMETDEDVEFYLTQVEMEKEGLDPLSLKDYKSFQLKNQEATKQTKQREEFLRKDSEEFVKKYPSVKVDELFADTRFKRFSKGKLGNVPLAEIYEDYQEFISEIDTKAQELAEKRLAKTIASPGDLKPSGADTTQERLYTFEELKKMSQAEISKNWDLVKKSQEALIKQKK